MQNVYKGALRCAVLDSGVAAEYKKARKVSYFEHDDSLIGSLRIRYGDDVVRVCRSLDNARVKRASRVKKRMVEYVLAGSCYFLTLTFKDEVLNNTSEETRRIYVARFLKAHFSAYVANIDYGDKAKNPDSHEREHYHALATLSNGEVPRQWDYGFISVKKVKETEKDATATAKYSAKLSNHALKVNGGFAPRLIYSRLK